MEAPEKLSDRLRREGDKIDAFFTRIPVEGWDSEVYTEDSTWTVRNVLAHLVTSERAFLRLFDNILMGGGGFPEDFSIDSFNADQQEKVKDLAPDELMGEFLKARSEMCTFVAGLTGDELELEGRHPFLHQVSLMEMIKMVYLHNQIHIRDVRKAIERTQ
jgi:hypothetical protein